MKTHWYLLILAVFLLYHPHSVSAQSDRKYKEITSVDDSSKISRTLRGGLGLAFQYNLPMDVFSVTPAGGSAPYTYGGSSDFELNPTISAGLDGLFFGSARYRLQFEYANYGFQESDGYSFLSAASLPYYRTKLEGYSGAIALGYQYSSVYAMYTFGYGHYTRSSFGVGADPNPGTPNEQAKSDMLLTGYIFGADIPLMQHKLYLSPEFYYVNAYPTNKPDVNFVPQTFSMGLRANLQWVIFEDYEKKNLEDDYMYAVGTVQDCRTQGPVAANVRALTPSGALEGETVADASGRYVLRLPLKTSQLEISKHGYTTETVPCKAPAEPSDVTIPLVSLKPQDGCDPRIRFAGHVQACESRKPLIATISVVDQSTGTSYQQPVASDTDGSYFLDLRTPGKYQIFVEAAQYVPRTETISLEASTAPAGSRTELHRLDFDVCDSINLVTYFDFDKAILHDDAKPYLSRIADYLRLNPNLTVSIEGHTDTIGKHDYNMALSRSRAKSIQDFLIERGIARERIAAIGYGPDRPIATNKTAEGRQKNRRVTLKQLLHVASR